MTGDDGFEDVRSLLRGVSPGRPPAVDPDLLIRRGRRRRRIESGVRWAEVALAVGATVGAVVFLVGNPWDHNSQVGPSTGPTPAAISSAGPTATPVPGPSTMVTTPVRASLPCGASELEVTVADGGVGLGHWAQVIRFRNLGSSACYLRGYPVVVASVSGGGRQVRAVPLPYGYLGGNYTSTRIAIAPGAWASAELEGTDVPVGNAKACPALSSLVQVTAPGTLVPVPVSLNANPADCSGVVVHPVVAGTTGRPSGQ